MPNAVLTTGMTVELACTASHKVSPADEITLDALAAAVNLSTYHFARSFARRPG